MSFIRFGEQRSDVYVYEASDGLVCCGCHFVKDGFRAASRNPEEMLRHLELHRLAGDTVPEKAFSELRAAYPARST